VIRLKSEGVRWELSPEFAPWLDAVLKSPGQGVKESTVKSVTRHQVAGKTYYVKRYRHHAVPLRSLKYFFTPSQARQEWKLAQKLEFRRVPVVHHVAWGERWSGGGSLESILITEGFDGVPLDQVRDVDLGKVLEFVEGLHDRGVLHEDLHPGNLLVKREPLELRLIDLHGTTVKSRLTADERARNLALLRVNLPIRVSPEVERVSAGLRRRLLLQRSKRCFWRNREFTRQRLGGLTWNVRLPFFNPAIEGILADPDGFLKKRAQILKPGRTSTVGRAERVVLKRFNLRKILSLAKDLTRDSRARRAYRHAYHLELLGIPTARSIATADRRAAGVLLRSYFLMEEITGATDLGACLRSNRVLDSAVIHQAASIVGQLHQEGYSHRDLKETNLVLDKSGHLYLIDLDGLKYFSRIAERRAALDLLRLARGVRAYPAVTRSHRVRFLLKYCRVRGLRRVPRLR
jgi:tRNA A-37 threonylcarbamoyl transferase component Bud32